MAERENHGLGRRIWTDTFLGVAALFVSAISLWIGIRTEQANEHLVAASSWPYLYVESSNANADAAKVIQLDVINSGVGPAKVEAFEVIWNGQAWPAGAQLMKACCNYAPSNVDKDPGRKHTDMLEGGVQGTVIRAGETRSFLRFPLADDNADVWHALNKARQGMRYRICYCSVFDECWIGNFSGIDPLPDQLHPQRVKTCPVPKTPFLQ